MFFVDSNSYVCFYLATAGNGSGKKSRYGLNTTTAKRDISHSIRPLALDMFK